MTSISKLALSATVALASLASAEEKKAGNPVFEGWYADPEGIIFQNQYWIYPTFSAAYEDQTHFDAFSSPDLKTWTKHEKVLDTKEVKWANKAMWAPSIIEKGGKFYFFFSANDIQNNEDPGGIGVAVADKPQGPFKDLIGKPLIDKFHHGAQPIDGFVFRDDDGSHYFIYGGWRHCNIVKLKDDFTGLVPFENGETYRSITPKGYVEGPFVFKKNGKYYFMWSEGGWTGPDYRVAYAISDSLFGPHERIGVVLEQDDKIARGAGHHSIIHNTKDDSYYIVYHRRPIGVNTRDHRETCIEKLEFDEKGLIKPVKMTVEGVAPNPLR
ncbi:glycoside hydrolase family 43 protein [Luteolibacter flavescens]|uniref:Glycoside hydrolase family 43 protein n=1 Tax=Luteolibacter flavescens TaxID=1859460 RepID=A0ABT3FN47_9BACT|nr:glycoside hydrolase family 43 protein [Luteolibacter flavescens]MCW1884759.1 glycoside hydrolase family 43 protein [Luteolibacter flavescens]